MILGAAVMTHRVLLVEDDPGMLCATELALTAHGFSVWAAATPRQALAIVRTRGLPHLAVLDYGLPDMDGGALAAALQSFGDVPVIMITGYGDPETRIAALENFADDYLVKPFHPRELLARMHRVLARHAADETPAGAIVALDDRVSLELGARRLIVDGQRVALTPTEARILHVLLAHAGRPVHRHALARRVWQGEEANEETLRVHVHRLRRKAAKAGGDFLRTVRGVGYCLRVAGGPVEPV